MITDFEFIMCLSGELEIALVVTLSKLYINYYILVKKPKRRDHFEGLDMDVWMI